MEQSLADAHKRSMKYLETIDRNIELVQRLQKCHLEVLERSNLYIRIMANSKNPDFHLSDIEWQELGKLLDEAYGQFTQRLRALADISDEELKTCYLLKINIAPINIADIVFKTKGAISMQQKRLYKKITLKEGTAKDFCIFISRF